MTYIKAPHFDGAVKRRREEQVPFRGMIQQLCDLLEVAREAMNELLVFAAPFPGNQVPVLCASDIDLVIVEQEYISDEVLLDCQFRVSAHHLALLDLVLIFEMIEAHTLLVPRHDQIVECVDFETLDPLCHLR